MMCTSSLQSRVAYLSLAIAAVAGVLRFLKDLVAFAPPRSPDRPLMAKVFGQGVFCTNRNRQSLRWR